MKKTIRNNKNNSPKKKSKKLPNKSQCNAFNKYHLPWKSSQYKKKCLELGCLHKKGYLGSYCYDPITLTNINIDKSNLNSETYLPTLTIKELIKILKECNVADKTYQKKITKQYLTQREYLIKNIVINTDEDLLIKLTDDSIKKIIKNAEDLNLKKIKSFEELFFTKFICHEKLFSSNYGNSPQKYYELRWKDLENNLHNYGIYKDSFFYNLGKKHFLIYSCNSPYYFTYQNKDKKCLSDCDCLDEDYCGTGSCRFNYNLKYKINKKINYELPKGNWIDSARYYIIKNNILYAELRNRNGRYNMTSTYYDENDIFQNIDGRFKLIYPKRVPKGTWIIKTRNYIIKYNILFAEIKDNKGKYKYQFTTFNNDSNIIVRNGKLICL